MSWLFSQALVEAYSPATFLAGEQSAQLNVMPTQHKFSRNDKTMEPCDLSQFGLTLRVLTEDRGAAVLTSFLADFPARTSVQPEQAQELKANDPDFGKSSAGLFATFNRDLSTWKTVQCSLLGDSESFSETWPRWGSMRNGASYLRQIPALPICASASGLWPTPTVNGNHNQPSASASAGWGLSSAVKLWQTPVADDAIERTNGKWNSRGEPKLSAEVKLWPTPTAITNSGGTAMCKWGGSGARKKLRGMVTSEELNGQLNPTWVEWLMGWPIGWTELKPLEMARFREWLQQHGGF